MMTLKDKVTIMHKLQVVQPWILHQPKYNYLITDIVELFFDNIVVEQDDHFSHFEGEPKYYQVDRRREMSIYSFCVDGVASLLIYNDNGIAEEILHESGIKYEYEQFGRDKKITILRTEENTDDIFPELVLKYL